MIKLSSEWGERLSNQAETGMGYWIVTVLLKDGRRYERAVIVDSGHLAEIYGLDEIPFVEDDIADLIVTHDKWKFS